MRTAGAHSGLEIFIAETLGRKLPFAPIPKILNFWCLEGVMLN